MQLTSLISFKFKFNYWVGTSHYRVILGGLDTFSTFFSKSYFFSSQLVSAFLSALFLLRKFCSVAHLNFNCLAWHICLEFLFEKKTSIMKVHGIGFFILFFEMLWKFLSHFAIFFLKNPSTDF